MNEQTCTECGAVFDADYPPQAIRHTSPQTGVTTMANITHCTYCGVRAPKGATMVWLAAHDRVCAEKGNL